MVRDPVCGMTVNEKDAKYTSQHAEQIYYFCSASCKSTFDKNPSRYTGRERRPMHMHHCYCTSQTFDNL